MSRLNNPLVAGAADEYVNHIVTRITAGDDATALESSLRAFDSAAGGEAVKERLVQVLEQVKETRIMSGGQADATIATGGTGYAVGDVIPLVGDGSGAYITVTSETGGVIDGIEVTAGLGYTTAPTADSTGVGNADATFTVTVSNGAAVIDATIAAVQAAV